MSVGTLTDSTNQAHTLEVFQTESGRVDDRLVAVEEELLASGVDGRRFRTVSNRYRIFQAVTILSCLDYAAAITKARALEAMIGTECKLSLTLGGATYTYNRIHAMDCHAVAKPGPLSGAGISSTNAAYVVASWSFAVTDSPIGSTP